MTPWGTRNAARPAAPQRDLSYSDSTMTGSAYASRPRAGLQISGVTAIVKPYLTYAEQVALLCSRGMSITDEDRAIATLRTVNYYRLSGYWYPFRQITNGARADQFYPGTDFDDVVSLYRFDEHLRVATFSALGTVELAIRSLLGHELGRVDPLAHLNPNLLGARARTGNSYGKWLGKFNKAVTDSPESFVDHHKTNYAGILPVWAAIEVMDWGALTYLYGFAPNPVRDAVAAATGLTSPQLESWLKALNAVRNTCAHHGRLFNRVHALSPKLSAAGLFPELDSATTEWNRTFSRLTMIQFLLAQLQIGNIRLLPAVVNSYPAVKVLPISHMGAPLNWKTATALWSA